MKKDYREIEHDISHFVGYSENMIRARNQFTITSLDKIVIFNGPKLGSTTMNVVLNQDPCVLNIPLHDMKLSTINEDEVDKLKQTLSTIKGSHKSNSYIQNSIDNINNVQKDFENILSGMNKKDILILFRDPFKRYVSAFGQDYIKDFLWPTTDGKAHNWWENPLLHGGNINSAQKSHPFLKGFLLQSGFTSDQINSYLDYDLIKGAPKTTDDVYRVFIKIYQLLFRNYFKISMTYYRHYRPYLPHHLSFFKSLGNSQSKVKFLNIDDFNFSNYLNKYDKRFDLKKHHDSSSINEMIESVVIAEMKENTEVSNYINFILSYEYTAYYELYNTHKKHIIENID